MGIPTSVESYSWNERKDGRHSVSPQAPEPYRGKSAAHQRERSVMAAHTAPALERHGKSAAFRRNRSRQPGWAGDGAPLAQPTYSSDSASGSKVVRSSWVIPVSAAR
ncbi:hypothetical protein [Paenibacillus glycinis]|uniref:Uncharacterized protein n=1 Tax=Paenibacillus glycinis TaxID=2697035 RepID=A0ABW9XUC4_9BACL|nr:hypothetical protein [Paenibacillus glycinis]NBD26273.1 hypothetical protein [Paenibacillus glycinis]